MAGRYLDWFEAHPETSLADVCYTAGTGRSSFEQRAALVVESAEQTQGLLSALARGEAAAGLHVGSVRQPKLAWLFSGQGSQYTGR